MAQRKFVDLQKNRIFHSYGSLPEGKAKNGPTNDS